MIRQLKARRDHHFISHKLEIWVGDRICVLRDGKIITTDVEALSIERSSLYGRPPNKDKYPRSNTGGAPGGPKSAPLTCSRTFPSKRRGEVLGIAGLVGTGRTELARAIVGGSMRRGDLIDAPCQSSFTERALKHGLVLTEDRRSGLILNNAVQRYPRELKST